MPKLKTAVGSNKYWDIKHDPKTTITYLIHVLKYHHKQKLGKQKSYTKAELSAWLTRLERGVLLYQFCSVAELRQFIAARGVRVPPSTTLSTVSSKARLIAALDKADKDATFTRLFDLPTELRAMIFVKYFDTLQQPLMTPALPPIALANKQLYGEIMPLFYKNNGFAIEVVCGPMEEAFYNHIEDDSLSEGGFDGDVDSRTYIDDKQLKWLDTVKTENFAAMASFCIGFSSCCATLRLWWNPKNETIGWCTGHGPRSDGDCDFCFGYVQARLDSFFGNLPQGTKISKKLIHRFVIVLDDILSNAISQYNEMNDV